MPQLLHSVTCPPTSGVRHEVISFNTAFLELLRRPPYLVKKEMQELIAWYTWAVSIKAKHPLILIANFIFEYLAIHPFQDGNGRTSRLLTNLMLLQQGY